MRESFTSWEDLQVLHKRHELQNLELCEHEACIPRSRVKRSYDSVREDPAWYLRKDLVEECVERRGCCSRGCGCCQRRPSTTDRQRGIGDCTSECGCCVSHRGFEYSEQEKKAIADQRERMLKTEPPIYLLQMTEAYFAKPVNQAGWSEPELL